MSDACNCFTLRGGAIEEGISVVTDAGRHYVRLGAGIMARDVPLERGHPLSVPIVKGGRVLFAAPSRLTKGLHRTSSLVRPAPSWQGSMLLVDVRQVDLTYKPIGSGSYGEPHLWRGGKGGTIFARSGSMTNGYDETQLWSLELRQSLLVADVKGSVARIRWNKGAFAMRSATKEEVADAIVAHVVGLRPKQQTPQVFAWGLALLTKMGMERHMQQLSEHRARAA